MTPNYYQIKKTPLTKEEIEDKYIDIQDEMKELLKWKAEEENNLKDKSASPQKLSAAKRALKKVARRIDTVNGQIIYWKLRKKGESHFKASLEMNEYWASCNDKIRDE
jgi:hypothetical protein